jgi:uncharacterized protein YegP (UPF0339 family)
MMYPKFLVVGGGHAWRWKLINSQGHIMHRSRMYASEEAAAQGAKKMRQLARIGWVARG